MAKKAKNQAENKQNQNQAENKQNQNNAKNEVPIKIEQKKNNNQQF